MKILTFVIPAYNSEKYLDKCITSMLKPGLLDEIEIIVVNDGSTDRTSEIASKYVELYPDTVRLIDQENRGHGGALNTGCMAAKAKYLKVIDADDWANTDSLIPCVKKLRECESDVVITFYHTIHQGTAEVRSWRCFPEKFDVAYSMTDIMKTFSAFHSSFMFHGIIYRSDFYQSYTLPLPEHIFYDDHVFTTFPCCYAKSITPLDLYVYEYRIGDSEQSVSRSNQVKRHTHTEKVLSVMEHRYQTMEDTAGRQYVGQKIIDLMISYFSIMLLSDVDRREGRALARTQYKNAKMLAPDLVRVVRYKYYFFMIMNYLHISEQVWDGIISSSWYDRVRGKHTLNQKSDEMSI